MNRRRALSLLVATVTVLSLAVGSGSFTAVEADRGVSVNVVSDDNAYVGYNSSDVGPVEKGDEIKLVKLSNRFAKNTTLSVEAVDIDYNTTSMKIDPVNYPTLESGESKFLRGEVTNCEPGTTNVEVTVELNGGSVWAKIFGDYYTRTFNVTCEGPSVDGVTFIGNGKIEISASNLETFDVTYLTVEKVQGSYETPVKGKETGLNSMDLQRQQELNATTGEKFVAIKIKNDYIDVSYVRETYNLMDETLANSSKANGEETTAIDWESYDWRSSQ